MERTRKRAISPTATTQLNPSATQHEHQNSQPEAKLATICRHTSPVIWSTWFLTHLALLSTLISNHHASHHRTLLVHLASTTFILLKTLLTLTLIIPLLWKLSTMSQRFFPPPRFLTHSLPPVILIICCCGEDPSLILNTVRAACGLDYPRDLLHIIIGDDGNDPELGGAVKRLAIQYPNLHYHARPASEPARRSKAANINSCLNVSRPAFHPTHLAVLDCDMIPNPSLLRALLEPFSHSRTLALVDSDQGFYNLPPNDPLTQSRGSRLDESCRNVLGAADCGGSGFAVRIDAYASVGGMPEDSVAEDVLFSHLLHRKGWQTLGLGDCLQWGCMPETMSGHVGQRRKWVVGAMGNGVKLGFGLIGGRNVRVRRRLEVFAYAMGPVAQCVVRPICHILIPVCVLVAGEDLVVTPTKGAFGRILLLQVLERVVWELGTFVEIPFGTYRQQRSQRHGSRWVMPLFFLDVLSVILPRTMGRKMPSFKATGSMKCQVNERDPKLRAPLVTRLGSVIWQGSFTLNTFIFVTAIGCFASSIRTSFLERPTRSPDRWQAAFHGVLFPGIGWEEYLSFFAPMIYMTFPPTAMKWNDMLEEDDAGVWRPKKDFKPVRWCWASWILDLLSMSGLAWAMAAYMMAKTNKITA